jgi:gas vesicle protein
MNRDDRPNVRKTRTWRRDIAFLLMGIGIGCGIALLLAPATGEELRHTIRRRSRRAAKALGRHTDNLRDRAGDLLEFANDVRKRGSSKVLELRRRAAAA